MVKMAQLYSTRNMYYLILGLCIFSVGWTMAGWKRATKFQVKNVDKTPKKETARSSQSKAVPVERIMAPALPDVLATSNPLNQTETKLTPSNRSDTWAHWQAEQAKRQDTLRRTCQRLDIFRGQRNISELIKSRKNKFWYFIVDDEYRLMYTWIAKVGSTSWMSAFLVLKGKYKRVEDVPFKRIGKGSLVKLSSLPGEGIEQRLANYTNFIFVRHPFVRLLSAYRNKLVDLNYYYPKRTGVHIIKKYRKNATKEALKKGTDVTFHEFVRYVVDTRNSQLDHHWRPVYKMVLPCTVRFDYIGKLETSEIDAKYILRETKVDHLVNFKPTNRSSVSHNKQLLNSFYSQIPRLDLVRLYIKFKPDFQLFGYEVPDNMKAILSGI